MPYSVTTQLIESFCAVATFTIAAEAVELTADTALVSVSLVFDSEQARRESTAATRTTLFTCTPFSDRLANAQVELHALYNHCGEAASEKCLSAATFVRQHAGGTRKPLGEPSGYTKFDEVLRSSQMKSLI